MTPTLLPPPRELPNISCYHIQQDVGRHQIGHICYGLIALQHQWNGIGGSILCCAGSGDITY